MKTALFMILFCHTAFAQLSLEAAKEKTVSKYHIGASTYFDGFVGHAGYGAIVILTADGGAASFCDGDEGTVLVKLTKSGMEQFKKKVTHKGDEMEPQAVAEDKAGNLYLFMLVYDHTKYRGGNERVVCYNKAGTLLWDKYIGKFSAINNPIVSWVRTGQGGGLELRGHIATEKPEEGKDPVYRFWEATLNSKDLVTPRIGDAIDWAKSEWQ
ncbi:MAG: hypothetical protein JNK10_14560 [Cyclobacteriaceae bacterium]|nr:hypothetical protein [Cyclobacteriaceae bacterium]